MKELKILGRSVTVDIEKLSKGLHELHAQDEGVKTLLSFGMLDYNLCELMEVQLLQSIKKEFSELTNELFKERIEQFSKECSNEISKGVYRHANMVV